MLKGCRRFLVVFLQLATLPVFGIMLVQFGQQRTQNYEVAVAVSADRNLSSGIRIDDDETRPFVVWNNGGNDSTKGPHINGSLGGNDNESDIIFKEKPLVIWGNDYHNAPMRDVKDFLPQFGVKFIDKSLSYYCDQIHNCEGRKRSKF